MEDQLAGDVFKIRLSDLCDLCVKYLLQPTPAAWMEDQLAGNVFMILLVTFAISV